MNYPENHMRDGAKAGAAAAKSYSDLSNIGKVAFARAFARDVALVEEEGWDADEMTLQDLGFLMAALTAEYIRVSDALPLGA